MKLRSCACGPAVLASVMLLAVPATSVQAADCQELAWSHDRLSKFDAVIASLAQNTADRPPTQAMQDQITGFDAAIASLEQDVVAHEADSRIKGEAVLKEIRAIRDAYHAKLRLPHLIATAQAADAPQSPEEVANVFWIRVNTYFEAVNADIATRQAATQTKFLGN